MNPRAPRRLLVVVVCLVAPLVAGCVDGPPPAGAACPANPTAETGPQGAINLSWEPVPDAESYPILRSHADSEPRPIANVSAANTSYTDTHVEPGTTYHYTVHSWNGTARSMDCPTTEVSSVPFFPSLAVTVAIGGLAAFGILRFQKRR